MICLSCRTEIKGDPPLECPECEVVHEARPPVVGINHFSQILCALDQLAHEEIDVESFEAVFFSFVDHLEQLDQKWGFRDTALAPRLAPSLKDKFGTQLAQMDEALQLGFQSVEWVEAILAGESDDFEAAESCLVGFFQGICAASATLLDNLEQFQGGKSGGMLFNVRSV